MKIKNFIYFISFIYFFSEFAVAMAGDLDYRGLDISDDAIEDTTATQKVKRPVRKVIKEILQKDESELQSTERLSFSSNTIQGPGLNIIVEELMPSLPHIKVLDLSYNAIGKKGLPVLIKLLRTYPSLNFVNITSNGVARILISAMQGPQSQEVTIDSEANRLVQEKVIVKPVSLVDETFNPLGSIFEVWHKTHKRYYESYE